MKKLLICLIMLFLVSGCLGANENNQKKEIIIKEEKIEEKKKPVHTSIKLSFAGDCTLGNYASQAYDGSFNQEYEKQGKDATYFLSLSESSGSDVPVFPATLYPFTVAYLPVPFVTTDSSISNKLLAVSFEITCFCFTGSIVVTAPVSVFLISFTILGPHQNTTICNRRNCCNHL